MKLAIFDVDGTLLDNLVSEDACYAAALAAGLGLTTLDTDWRTYAHVSDQGVAVEAHQRVFGLAPSSERLTCTIEHFLKLLAEAHAREPVVPVVGAADLLASLPEHGWIPALATGAWRRAAQFKLGAARLAVDAVPFATAEDGPDRVAIVRAAWARAEGAHRGGATGETAFERVVLVGDGVWDVAAAKALDLPFVGRAVGEREEELRACGATTVIADFARIDAVLAAFEGATVPSDAS